MKKITTILLLSFIGISAFAQTSGGPDPYGYTWRSSNASVNPTPYSWFDITSIGTQVTGLGDDNYVGPFSASAGFQYYWYSTPQFYIGSNGFISFNGTNIASPFPSSIPDPLGSNDFIAPLLADLNFVGGSNPGRCYYYSNTDTLCVSFVNVPFWYSVGGTTGSTTFQIILNRVDKSITFNYQSMNMGSWSSIDAIVGIENITGTLGLGCFIDSMPPSLSAIKFKYPSVVTYQVKDVGVNWNANDRNGGVFVKKQGAAPPFLANIKNFGNQALTNITIYDTIYNSSGNAVSNGDAFVSGLTPGQNSTVQFSDTLTAPSAGTYVLKTRTAGVTGDLVASNNTMELEVIAVDTTANTINFDYSDGIPDGVGLGWSGGGGGIAVYIEPPTYPVKVKETSFYISASTAGGFYSIMYANDGPGGGPGTLLDSVYVGSASITLNSYTTVSPSKTIIIDSGGVYVYWKMGGPSINIGRDITKPISRRTYEILGGNWSTYRDVENEDFLIGLRVAYPFPKADFKMNKTADPLIAFTDQSTNTPTSWLWDFGDGTTDTLKNPSHTYALNDTFQVCLTATNKYGSNTVCKQLIISGNVPTADFSYDSTNAPSYIFYDESTNSPTGWHWDFNVGPGDTSNLMNTAFKFKTNGSFNVCLIAKNVNGSSQPYCHTFSVGGIGIEDFGQGSFELFPNPMEDYSTVRLSNEFASNQVNISLINLQGQNVPVRINKNGLEYRLYKDQIPSGQYILQLTLNSGIVSRVPLQIK